MVELGRGRSSGAREGSPLREFAASRSAWVSIAEAARISGRATPTIQRATRDGLIERREAPSREPNLRHTSVESFALIWAERQRQRAQAEPERRDARPRLEPPTPSMNWIDHPGPVLPVERHLTSVR
jgi:hypothetical protein